MSRSLTLLLVVLCGFSVLATGGVVWFAQTRISLPRQIRLGLDDPQTDAPPPRARKNIWSLVEIPRWCPTHLEKQTVANVLVAGVDGILRTPLQHRGRGRTDSIHLIRLYSQGRHAMILSLPRDLRVLQGDTQEMAKINAAYADGGTSRLIRTVERFLSVNDEHPVTVDRHLVVNLEAFIGVVDAFGGIDLTVDKRMKYRDRWGGLDIDLQPGFQHLTGRQAMGFVRFRKDKLGDLQRIVRQQQFAREFISQTSGLRNRLKLKGLYDDLTENKDLETDLSFCDFLYMKEMFEGQEVDQRLIPLTVAVDDLRLGRVSYLQPLEKELREMNKVVFRQPLTQRFLTAEPLHLVNTCPAESRGLFIKGLLRANGLRLSATERKTRPMPKTTEMYGPVSQTLQAKLGRVFGQENLTFFPDLPHPPATGDSLSGSLALTPSAPLGNEENRVDPHGTLVLGWPACQGL